MFRRLVYAASFSVTLAIAVLVGSLPKDLSAQRPGALNAQAREGESRTVLPDGRILILGGMDDGASVARAAIIGNDGSRIELQPPAVPRAWHTATVLADGRVLLFGGLAADGQPVTTAELYEPAARAASSPIPSLDDARWAHTATLLSDGRVLIVGGRVPGNDAADSARIFNPRSGELSSIDFPLSRARRHHTATLTADGSVLIEGGVGLDGAPIDQAEQFEPASSHFAAVTPPSETNGPASLADSLPIHGASDVQPDATVALRFTRPILPGSISAGTVILEADGSPVPVRVVVAEAGRLLFAAPERRLSRGTLHTLSVTNAVDNRGNRVSAEIAFITADEPGRRPRPAASDIPEEWVPSAGNFRGNWRSGRPASPWASLPPLKAGAGVTAVAGQVLRLDGRPFAGAAIEIAGKSATSDHTGRFLLTGLPQGSQQIVIDGRPASAPGRQYGLFLAKAFVHEGRTNVLPFTMWMPRIDTAHAVRLSYPLAQDVVIRTPRIPGLELHLPKGVVVRDHEGNIASEISITPIPVDRPPFPLPTGIEVPVYFTIQPGGGFISSPGSAWPAGARVVYPNFTGERPGSEVHFWNFDPQERGWHVYGLGRVDASGTRVVPDRGASIYRFTGTMINSGQSPPGTGPFPGGGPSGGDPVDLATGLFVMEKTDLYLPDVLPIALTRTYRQNDSAVRPFGIGATHQYAIFLWSAQQYQEADLILPDGGRVHYVRTSSGTGFMDAVFEHTGSPSRFHKSKLSWVGAGWELALKDGTVYVFGDMTPLQSIRDRFGNAIHLTWSGTNGVGQGTGRIVKITSTNGRFIEFTYDTSNRITQAADNIGRTVGYEYDTSGRLWKVTDAAGGVTEYTYDSSHRMLTIEDPRNIVYLTNEYDSNGRVSEQTLANSGTYLFAYTLDGSGRVVQTDVTNPRGYVTRSTFNSSGYSTSLVEAVGTSLQRTTTYTRQSGTNLLTAVTDPLSRQTTYGYDTNGNLTSVTELAGTSNARTTSFTYHSTFHTITSVTDPLNHTRSIAYDTRGAIQSNTNALSHQTTFATNGAGQVTAVTNPLSKTVSIGQEFGDVINMTVPSGASVTRFVDAAGRLRTITDASGGITRLAYNAVNLLTKVTDPLGGETTLTYDGNGNLLTLTDARSKTTTWTYNSMDLVATRTDPLNRQESFTYDLNGNLTEWTDRKGQVTAYQYDALDRRTFAGFNKTGNPATYESTISITYDAGSRWTQIVDSGAGTISRTYDLQNRLTQEVTGEGTIDYTYDAAGRRSTMQVQGQTQVSYSYDNANRMTAVTQGTTAVGIAYDSADRRTSLTLPNGVVIEYDYDDDSQLTGLTYKLGSTTLGTLTYTYDANGQRTAVAGTWARLNLPAALTSATYDDANQIATWAGASVTYDANGNLSSDASRSYTWNARNQLTAVTGSVSGSFGYDGLGRRRTRTVGGTAGSFLYDVQNSVQELASGTPTANLLPGLILDEYFARVDSGGASNYLPDVLGSTVALASSSGTVTTEYTYEPFGKLATAGSSTTNPVTYTGRDADGTGLYFYRNRYFDPGLQRFVSEDPLRFAAGVNAHAYVANAPTNYTDPLGLWTVIAGAGFSAVGGTGIEGSAGIAINPGWSGCAGVGGFGSAGIGGGLNVGADAFGGIIFGGFDNVAGETVNLNFTGGPISVTIMLQPGSGRWAGITVGKGPSFPVGFSTTYSKTGTIGVSACPPPTAENPPPPPGTPGGAGGSGGPTTGRKSK